MFVTGIGLRLLILFIEILLHTCPSPLFFILQFLFCRYIIYWKSEPIALSGRKRVNYDLERVDNEEVVAYIS